MTVDRQKGKVVFVCDGCGDGLDTETDDWANAMAVLRREEWQVKRVGDARQHFCTSCKGRP